jgi:hypothetical protein
MCLATGLRCPPRSEAESSDVWTLALYGSLLNLASRMQGARSQLEFKSSPVEGTDGPSQGLYLDRLYGTLSNLLPLLTIPGVLPGQGARGRWARSLWPDSSNPPSDEPGAVHWSALLEVR